LIEALSTSYNWALTLIFLAACCASGIAAAAIGIDDNPPGLLLAYVAVAAFVLAFVHPWRTARQFRFLVYASILGFALFAILHNVFEAAATSMSATAGALHNLLQALGVAAFLLAVLICPAALFVGAAGSVVMFIRSRRRPA